MREHGHNDVKRYYADILEVQKRLRALVEVTGITVELEPDPSYPRTGEDLLLALSVVRGNSARVEKALNAWDREVNGCETRTRERIRQNIAEDEETLQWPVPLDSPRSREKTELNLRYDRMQLHRNRPPHD